MQEKIHMKKSTHKNLPFSIKNRIVLPNTLPAVVPKRQATLNITFSGDGVLGNHESRNHKLNTYTYK